MVTDKEIELWKPFPLHPLYEVSSLGNILDARKGISPKICNKNGYRTAFLKKGHLNGELHNWKQWLVHRMVAITFLDNPMSNTVVNHKDGNKTNNKASNLEWCTNEENIRHYFSDLREDPFDDCVLMALATYLPFRKKGILRVSREMGLNHVEVAEVARGNKGAEFMSKIGVSLTFKRLAPPKIYA